MSNQYRNTLRLLLPVFLTAGFITVTLVAGTAFFMIWRQTLLDDLKAREALCFDLLDLKGQLSENPLRSDRDSTIHSLADCPVYDEKGCR